jgi:rare lipoprotein A
MAIRRNLLRAARLAAVCALAGGLAACGSSDPKPEPQSAGVEVPTRGYYKVGRPYRISGVWYTPAVDYDYDETGIASWYGPGFHGQLTANGERYDQYDLTAAHPTLPLPSLVRVTNLENGRQVELRINDRGPFKNGRIIDVSKRGAELLGFLTQGTAKVRVQVLERESRQLADLARRGRIGGPETLLANRAEPIEAAPVETVAAEELPPQGAAVRPQPSPGVTQVAVRPSSLFVQAGAFSAQTNALDLAQRLSVYGSPQISEAQVGGQTFWRVRLGPLPDVEAADSVLSALIDGGFPQSRVVVE